MRRNRLKAAIAVVVPLLAVPVLAGAARHPDRPNRDRQEASTPTTLAGPTTTTGPIDPTTTTTGTTGGVDPAPAPVALAAHAAPPTTKPAPTPAGPAPTTTRPAPTTTRPAAPTTTSTRAPAPPSGSSLKPVIQGLCDRQHIARPPYLDLANCAVVKAEWADLQPTRGGPIAENNVIDQAIAEANRLNASDPGLRLRLKLRVYAGISAPEWAKQLDGAPVALGDPQTGAAIGTVPRFWTTAFGAAYDDLMAKLAARYDQVPILLDVVVSRCTTQFAEPFLRQGQTTANRAAYFAAGFTVAADQRCLREQIDTHARLWRQTRSSVAFNPYQSIEADKTRSDVGFTEEMMVYCRSVLGSRCVLGNNSISSPLDAGPYTTMYAKIRALGPPYYFQTATAAKIGDWSATLDWAATHGADMVELPAGYDDWPLPDLARFDARLEANPTG